LNIGSNRWRAHLTKGSQFLSLGGDLFEDPRARILNVLLIALLAWCVLLAVFFLPLNLLSRLRFDIAAGVFYSPALVTALILLRRNAFTLASAVSLASTGTAMTAIVVFNGGIHSVGLVEFVSIPILAAWLLGYRGVVVSSAYCLFSSLGMAISDYYGVQFPRLPAPPFRIWAVLLHATIVSVIPVVILLRVLNKSLEISTRSVSELREAQVALRRERDLIHRITETCPVGIVAVNRFGLLTFLNLTTEKILGLSRNDAMQQTCNDPAWQVTTPDGKPVADTELPFRQVQVSLRPLYGARFTIARPDGRRIPISVNAVPLLSSEDSLTGWLPPWTI
jgi:PAS domain S-box-containing protein